MKALQPNLPLNPLRLLLALLLSSIILALTTSNANANVYASNVRVNGSSTNLTASAGDTLVVSYILNEPASAGVTVDLLRGTTLVRRVTLLSGPGTQRGSNAVELVLRDAASNNVTAGMYSVAVTAASLGYGTWTHITSDGDPNTFVYDGRGISVDKSQESASFGRIYIANSAAGNDPFNNPGDVLGILKFNADGSAPPEGIAGNGGRNWPGNELGPWKMETAGGYVYANDLSLNGQVFRWDSSVSSNSLTQVLADNNRPPGATLGGMALQPQGTNWHLWMSDRAGQNGVVKWSLGPDGICVPGDTGTNVIGFGAVSNGLTLPPQDVALDPAGNIYVCQSVAQENSPLPRVFRYAAYDPATNAGQPAVVAEWAVGAGDDTYGGASGIAVDPTGTYVAVAFQGVSVFGLTESGNTKVLYATNGAVAAELDLNLVILDDPTHQDTDCAWDAAGNVYYIDNWWGRWRAVSPPGTNQWTTPATASIVISGETTPATITGITLTNGMVLITFTGSPGDTPDDFTVLAAPDLSSAYAVVPNAPVTMVAPGQFSVLLPVSGNMQFFRIERSSSPPTQQPEIKTITVSAGTVTITFAADSGALASAFTLLDSANAAGPFSPVTTAQISVLSPGLFQATAATNGPMRFYRIQRQ